MLVFTLLLLIGLEVEGTLQAWHRKDCSIVVDLNSPLSKLVAHHFDLSEHYIWSQQCLRILVRKLAFRNKTNEQAVAVMKFLDSDGYRRYFVVLLENCGIVEPSKKGGVKRFFFELNTVHRPLDHLYPSLRAAKHGAALFEKSGKWPVPLKSNVTEIAPKTNGRKHLIQGIGWSLYVAFSPITIPMTLLVCVIWAGSGGPREPAPYVYVGRHWGATGGRGPPGAAGDPWRHGPYGAKAMEMEVGKHYKIGVKVNRPDEKVQIPAQKVPISVQKGPIPVQKGPIPVQKGPIPVQKVTIGVQRVPIPVQKGPIPVQNGPIPAQ